MLFRLILPALAAAGILISIFFTFTYGSAPNAEANQLSAPPATPFEKTVSGTGLVEANTRNITIGAQRSGVVYKIYVKEGQIVKAGEKLFEIDSEAAKAAVDEIAQAVEVERAQIGVKQAELQDAQDQLNRSEGLTVGSSISVDTLQRRRFSARIAQAEIAQAKARMAQARAQLESAKVELAKHKVTAPVDGRIFKINIREGEYINLQGGNTIPLIMGNDRPLHLRVQVDENDLWRFSPTAPAQGSLRSNKELNFKLRFVRIEPYVQAKRDLSGDTAERIDTRVLEVIYAFDPADKPIFVGQQMDVFIEAKHE